MPLIAAIGTVDGNKITDDHFGDAKIYVIIELDKNKAQILKQIQNTTPEEKEEHHHHHGDPQKAQGIGKLMKQHNVQVLVGKAFGPNIKRMLPNFSIVLVKDSTVNDAIETLTQNFDKILSNWQQGPQRQHLNLKL